MVHEPGGVPLIIAEGVGVRRTGLPETEVPAWGCACEGWGIATAEGRAAR